MGSALYDWHDMFRWIFSSPVPILTVIILKIFFNKKFPNKPFGLILILLFILLIYLIYADMTGVMVSAAAVPIYKLTPIEYFYYYFSQYICWGCIIFMKLCIVMLPAMILASAAYFVKTKDKTVFKKLFLSVLILLPFIYFSYPCHKFKLSTENFSNNDLKYIADNTKFTPVKVIMSDLYADLLQGDIMYKSGTNKNSDEIQKLKDDYAKYKIIAGDIAGYETKTLYELLYYEKFDELLYVLDKVEKRTGKLNPFRAELYIAQKQYQKALDIIDEIGYLSDRSKYLHLAKIYTGLRKFDKAYEYLEKYKNSLNKNTVSIYNKTKLYIDYKSGKDALAREEYAKLSKRDPRKQSFEDYIKNLERIEY